MHSACVVAHSTAAVWQHRSGLVHSCCGCCLDLALSAPFRVWAGVDGQSRTVPWWRWLQGALLAYEGVWWNAYVLVPHMATGSVPDCCIVSLQHMARGMEADHQESRRGIMQKKWAPVNLPQNEEM